MERDDIILKAKAQIKQVNDEGCANFTENERKYHQDHANFNAFVKKAAEDRNNLEEKCAASLLDCKRLQTSHDDFSEQHEYRLDELESATFKTELTKQIIAGKDAEIAV